MSRIAELPAQRRGRLESLLWFVYAMVYHDREPAEREPLVELIRSTVRKSMQPEVDAMSKTIAEAPKEEGENAGTRNAFLFLLRRKFKKVPENIVAEIQATTDNQQLENWLDAILTADSITDIPFKGQA